MSKPFWAAFWITLLTFAVVFALGVWYGSVRNQCEALGGTLLMSHPLMPVCVKLERLPLT